MHHQFATAVRRSALWFASASLLLVSCGGTGSIVDTTVAVTTVVDTTITTTTAPVTDATDAHPPIEPGVVGAWQPEILERFPHDPAAFTQGLLIDDGVVFESTGLYGESSLRRVDRNTGEVIDIQPLDAEFFAEGLELVDGELLQLTWQEETLVVWDQDSFDEVERIGYDGEGWGLCLMDDRLVMSDGSAHLAFRDPSTFDLINEIDVTLDDQPITMLNELECVGDLVFANVWQTTDIVVIDPQSGVVVAVIDASALDEDVSDAPERDVLNGIAYDPATDTFLVTGKLWPTMFEVRFVAADS